MKHYTGISDIRLEKTKMFKKIALIGFLLQASVQAHMLKSVELHKADGTTVYTDAVATTVDEYKELLKNALLSYKNVTGLLDETIDELGRDDVVIALGNDDDSLDFDTLGGVVAVTIHSELQDGSVAMEMQSIESFKSSPLYVVDGVPLSSSNHTQMDDGNGAMEMQSIDSDPLFVVDGVPVDNSSVTREMQSIDAFTVTGAPFFVIDGVPVDG